MQISRHWWLEDGPSHAQEIKNPSFSWIETLACWYCLAAPLGACRGRSTGGAKWRELMPLLLITMPLDEGFVSKCQWHLHKALFGQIHHVHRLWAESVSITATMIRFNAIGDFHFLANDPFRWLGVTWQCSGIITMTTSTTCTRKRIRIACRTAMGVATINATGTEHWRSARCEPRRVVHEPHWKIVSAHM